MKRFISVYIIFILILASAGIFFYIEQPGARAFDTRSYAVDLNEVRELYKEGNTTEADRKADQLNDALVSASEPERDPAALIISSAGILMVSIVFTYIYLSILKPFGKLSGFADEVAKGNMDLPLDYERTNYFGKFTWAFDRMRQNVRNSKESEREAIENNKTVIASLSHDIRTPVSSIRAYAEALEADMASTPEERARYISVILAKCEEVTSLTDDMLLHSLSDMDRLSVDIRDLDLIALISKTADELGVSFTEKGSGPLNVKGDPMRIIQIIENLLRNAEKYASTAAEISVEKDDGYAYVSIRDRGAGIPDEDIPFVFDKFYRGSNAGNIEGSGLGLYIVKYLVTKMNGEVRAENSYPGLTVKFSLPLS